MTDAQLDALAKDLFDWYVEWNPPFATYVGIHSYDHLLPKGTNEAYLEETQTTKEYLERVEGIDRKSLSPSKRVDHGVLRNALRLWIFGREEIGKWRSKPGGAEDVADALFPLFLRDFAPLPDRMESMIGRLERTPAYIEETKSLLKTPVKIWCEIGLETTDEVPGFFRLIQSVGRDVLDAPDRTRLDEAVARATEAVEGYGGWIRAEILPRAEERLGIGATKFRKLVRLRELGLTVEEIYGIGQRYLRESKEELARIASEIRPGATVEEAKEIVKGDHPATFEDALAHTAKAMEDAKRFLQERRLATIPPNEELRVIETPAYLRHVIPFAAYSQPAKFEKRQTGLYMVTTYADKPEMLREASYAGVRNTAVHEGYPGHHLQLTCANLNPALARLFADAVETVEGWAHYCEEMMKEAGFSADPATKFVQITDQIWRACRIIIDVDLHRGRMTFDESVGFLVRETGMERPGAIAEVKRYTYNPAYQLSYLLGKHLILRLREEVRKSFGKDYSDRLFHDTILYAGSLPMRYMREIFAHKARELRKLQRKGL